MIDLHTHSLFSDGVLLPLELIRRAHVRGCRAIAITDHVDPSNLETIVPHIIEACENARKYWDIKAIPGVEITHAPIEIIPRLAIAARKLGAKIIVVHGETIAEPVIPGTNHSALNSDIDILAHPGFISLDEAKLAKERGIFLEITARKGHSLTNGHVAKMAQLAGASLVVNTDSHEPDDLINKDRALQIALGAGLDVKQIDKIWENSQKLADRC